MYLVKFLYKCLMKILKNPDFSFLLEEIIRMSTRAWLLALAKNLYIISYSPLECGHLVG